MFSRIAVVLMVLWMHVCLAEQAAAKIVTDSLGRNVEVADNIDRVICSGPGCLRLLTYMQAEEMVVGVDDAEKRKRNFDARPYALANPQYKTLPLIGEYRGFDNPELILSLSPQPQVIFKTYPTVGHDAERLQQKTGIPVVALEYGNLAGGRSELFQAISLMGEVLNKEQRAAELIDFFTTIIADVKERSGKAADTEPLSVYLGGVAYRGAHGFQSTEPAYPPFIFLEAHNLAAQGPGNTKQLNHSIVAKEAILDWDPDILFVDLATLQLGDKASGLHQLRTDRAYRSLRAVRENEVYGVLPYNWYTQNFGSVVANAYFIGKLIYPEQFADIDPQQKARDIYTFLVGQPIFDEMNSGFSNLAFTRLTVNEQ